MDEYRTKASQVPFEKDNKTSIEAAKSLRTYVATPPLILPLLDFLSLEQSEWKNL